ncbi:hypothetical protein BVAD3_14180 [Bacillus velezensis]|nr:hypothetical protein BVAD3_14180 [Bacillus velezensis]
MANEAATAMNNTVASTDPTMARTLKKDSPASSLCRVFQASVWKRDAKTYK